MKTQLNEIKRMQLLAGIINEAEGDQNLSPEQAAAEASKIATKLDQSSVTDKIAADIAKDPKALQQLQSILKQSGINPDELSENIDPSSVQKLALIMAKKADQSSENISEEEGFDAGGALFTGLVGGGTLAHYLFRKETFDLIGQVQHSAAMGETLLGAIAGALLAVVAKKVYDNIKNR